MLEIIRQALAEWCVSLDIGPPSEGAGVLGLEEDPDIPASFIDPISQDIFVDPVVTADGQTYSRSAPQLAGCRGMTA